MFKEANWNNQQPVDIAAGARRRQAWSTPSFESFSPDEAIKLGFISKADYERQARIARIAECLLAGRVQAEASLSPAEVGAMDSGRRLVALRNLGLGAIRRTYRGLPQTAPVLPGLVLVIHAYSDNPEGYCWMSVARFGEILSRSERTIGRALKEGVETGVLGIEERPGDTNRYWLIGDRLLADARVLDVLDALSDAPAERGRPRKTPEHMTSDHFRGPGKTPETEGVKVRSESSGDSSSTFPDEEEEREGPPDVTCSDTPLDQATDLASIDGEITGPIPSGAQLARFTAEGERWAPNHGKDSKATLRRIVAALRHPPQVVDQAIDEALNTIAALDPQRPVFSAFVDYFQKTLRSSADRITQAVIDKREQITMATIRIQKQQRIADQGVEAYQRSISTGEARRASTGGASANRHSDTKIEDAGREIFVENAHLRTIRFHKIMGADGNRILRDVPMATPNDVRDILVDVSDEFSPRHEPSIKQVLDKATQTLRVRLMHGKYGPPEQWRRGLPASFKFASTDWFSIGEESVAKWRHAYPHAFPTEDYSNSKFMQDTMLYGIALDVWRFANDRWQTYGTGLQQSVEAEFERLLAKRQDEAIELVVKRQTEQDRKLAECRQQAVEAARRERASEAARAKLGLSPGDWMARTDEQKRDRLINAELAAMPADDPAIEARPL